MQHKTEVHYEKKTIPSGKNPTKLDASLIPKECNDKGDIRATKGEFCRDTQDRRTVKLPRLRLEDLVTQVTEDNVHKEISTGPAVGNEVW